MADAEQGEIVLLRDERGDYYIVAREVIERGKLEGELKDTVAEAAEGNVGGFNFGASRFDPIEVSHAQPKGLQAPFYAIGTFNYSQPAGVQIARTLLPGR